ncbi:nuclear transport factor 2 family protein [Micromonospora sp. PLK6-60]|uniref:YybH family protein n=1 Tax=Micromonospora sp. PLK6-60 TaxID=2873383 RepID=UPI001CA79AD1|nr:nuclear transport factor 2 family protein [Micromonospora sp. PLK6-60]MBY8870785.1 nuclear transport factor 2 family protein [Micromonospora sp. PLK6-60]
MYRRYNEAFDARDVDGLMRFYRDDVTKIDSTGDAQWDKEQVAALFHGLFQMSFTSSFVPMKEVIGEHTALLVLDSTLTFPDFEEHFITALTFTKQDGEWKLLVAASTNFPS